MSIEYRVNPSERTAATELAENLAVQTTLVGYDLFPKEYRPLKRRIRDAWQSLPDDYDGVCAAYEHGTSYGGYGDVAIGESAELSALRLLSADLTVINGCTTLGDYGERLKIKEPTSMERLRYFKGRAVQHLGTLGLVASGVAMAATEASPIADGVGVVSVAAFSVGTALRVARKPHQQAERIINMLHTSVDSFRTDAHTVTIPSTVIRIPHETLIALGEVLDKRQVAGSSRDTFQRLAKITRRALGIHNDPVLFREQERGRSVNLAELAVTMLERDAAPRDLWRTMLHDELSQWQVLHAAVEETNQCVKKAKQRQDYTGTEQFDGEIKGLEENYADAEEALVAAVVGTMSSYNGRYTEQQYDIHMNNLLGEHRAVLERAISVPEGELRHASPETLRVFRDVLFDVTLQVDTQDEVSVGYLHDMCQYIIGIAQHMTANAQAKQFYSGLTAKFGTRIPLPDWNDVEPKFIQAALYDK